MADMAADAARQAFAARLRELRLDARLNGRELAQATGMRPAKVSLIENGRQNPSEEDIRAWAIACGAALQIPELIAAHREVDQMWVEHRRNLRAGMGHVQASANQLYASTSLLRAYESNIVPGILQTADFVEAAQTTAAMVHSRPLAEVKEAVAARMERQRLIVAPSGKNTYSFVIEAGALEHGFGGFEVMSRQLDFLLTVAGKPHVSFGVIPPLGWRVVRPGEGFYLFDDRMVRSETWTGLFTSRRKDQITYYLRVFEMLRGMAVYGEEARALIEAARQQLSKSHETS